MRWELVLTQLAQPGMDTESARARERLFRELWQATALPEEREAEAEKGKHLYELATGIPFVRRSKKSDESGSSGNPAET